MGQLIFQFFLLVVAEQVEQVLMQVIFLEEQLEMVEQEQQMILQELQ